MHLKESQQVFFSPKCRPLFGALHCGTFRKNVGLPVTLTLRKTCVAINNYHTLHVHLNLVMPSPQTAGKYHVNINTSRDFMFIGPCIIVIVEE